LTRNGKYSKQKLKSSQFHDPSLVTQNQCSWWCTTCQLPVHSMLRESNNRWKTWHFRLQTYKSPQVTEQHVPPTLWTLLFPVTCKNIYTWLSSNSWYPCCSRIKKPVVLTSFHPWHYPVTKRSYSHFVLKGCDFTANSASGVRIESSGWRFPNPQKRTSPSNAVSLLKRCLIFFSSG
jgi:hypothetical protein